MSKTFYFNDPSLLNRWVISQKYFQIQTNGLELIDKWQSQFSVLEGLTLTPSVGTTIDDAATLTDEDDSTFTRLSGTSTQEIKYDLGVSTSQKVKRLDVHFVRQAVDQDWDDTIYSVSTDDTNYVELPLQESGNTDNDTYTQSFISESIEGIYHRYGKITFSGSSFETNEVWIREIKGYVSSYTTNSRWLVNKEYAHELTLSAISATTTGSGDLRIQLSKEGVWYYWDGSEWSFVGIDEQQWFVKSNTIADANTNIGTFLDDTTTNIEVGVKVFLKGDIAVESITLTA